MASLTAALGVGRGDVLAVVGAGGKTTLVYGLAAEARAAGLSVLVTTTTHMGTLPEAVTGPVLVEGEGGDLARDIAAAVAREGRVTVLGRRIRADKLEGLSREQVDGLRSYADLLIVEADGARGRSLKVPATHEPVIPASATAVVVVAAVDCLGLPLDEARVHRVALVCERTGAAPGDPVTEDLLVAALSHPQSYPSRVPSGARLVAFLNKADTVAAQEAAEALGRRLRTVYERVAAGSARGGEARAWT